MQANELTTEAELVFGSWKNNNSREAMVMWTVTTPEIEEKPYDYGKRPRRDPSVNRRFRNSSTILYRCWDFPDLLKNGVCMTNYQCIGKTFQ